jgi:hypothetical protein
LDNKLQFVACCSKLKFAVRGTITNRLIEFVGKSTCFAQVAQAFLCAIAPLRLCGNTIREIKSSNCLPGAFPQSRKAAKKKAAKKKGDSSCVPSSEIFPDPEQADHKPEKFNDGRRKIELEV